MSEPAFPQLYLLLKHDGGLVAFQESEAPWAGVLGFTSEQRAREFCRLSGLERCEIAAIDTGDHSSVSALIAQVKTRAIRYLLLDLDYHDSRCTQVEFEGDRFGASHERHFKPRAH